MALPDPTGSWLSKIFAFESPWDPTQTCLSREKFNDQRLSSQPTSWIGCGLLRGDEDRSIFSWSNEHIRIVKLSRTSVLCKIFVCPHSTVYMKPSSHLQKCYRYCRLTTFLRILCIPSTDLKYYWCPVAFRHQFYHTQKCCSLLMLQQESYFKTSIPTSWTKYWARSAHGSWSGRPAHVLVLTHLSTFPDLNWGCV